MKTFSEQLLTTTSIADDDICYRTRTTRHITAKNLVPFNLSELKTYFDVCLKKTASSLDIVAKLSHTSQRLGAVYKIQS